MGNTTRILFSGAEHLTKQSQIDAARITQKSGNAKRAAQSSLANFTRSLQNAAIVDRAGDNIGAIQENISRNLDASTSGKLAGRLSAAEELGASAAQAAAAGVGGSTIEAYNNTMRLSQSLVEASNDRNLNSDLYLADKAKGDVWRDAFAQTDQSQDVANLDVTQYVDHHAMSLMTKWFALNASAVATYFGGPQAGEAVSSAFMGQNDAQNGDLNGAARNFDKAFVGIGNGLKTYTSMGDSTKSGEAWGKGTWESTQKFMSNIHIK